MNVTFTGMTDDAGTAINVGDTLRSQDGYSVVVCADTDGSFFGRLVCEEDHSCRDIPYGLNGGAGHVVVKPI